MKSGGSSLTIGKIPRGIVIRLTGRAGVESSSRLKEAVKKLLDNGEHVFLFELSECLIMDSTFLGVLAGIGLKFSQLSKSAGPPTIELHNPNERILELLDNLGVGQLFNIVEHSTVLPKDLVMKAAASPESSKRELSATSLEAHETLMTVNPANIPKFKDVAEFLRQELEPDGES